MAKRTLRGVVTLQVHPKSSTKETPFSLVYDTNAMMPMEIGQPSVWREHYDKKANNTCLNTSLDLMVEKKEKRVQT